MLYCACIAEIGQSDCISMICAPGAMALGKLSGQRYTSYVQKAVVIALAKACTKLIGYLQSRAKVDLPSFPY